MEIIGFSGKAGSGKTSAAEVLEKQGFVIRSFADPIKWIATKWFGWDGKKDEKGRKLLQSIGKIGREYNPDTWIKPMEAYIKAWSDKRDFLLTIDDVRFQNEVDFIHKYKGIVINLSGRSLDLGKNSDDISEKGVKADVGWEFPDYNSKEDFQKDIETRLLFYKSLTSTKKR